MVTTSIGAEGLQLQDGVHALIADVAESFAGNIVRLASDTKLCARLASAGRDALHRYLAHMEAIIRTTRDTLRR